MRKTKYKVGRRRAGFSLVTVMLIGTCAALWLTAMTAALLPMYKRAGDTNRAEDLRIAAESSLDYVVDQLSNANVYGNPTTYDPSSGNFSKVSIVPLSVVGVPGVSVSVTVKRITIPTQPTSSSPKTSIQDQVSQNGPLAKYWRAVEATATADNSNGATALTRTFRIILKPIQWSVSPPGTSNPTQQYSAFGYGAVTLNRNSTTDGYTGSDPKGYSIITKLTGSSSSKGNVPLGGDVGSYGKVALNGSSRGGADATGV